MNRFRFSCLDIVLFAAFTYAISDCIKNWEHYQSCEAPLHAYILVSIITLLVFRMTHFLGQFLSGDFEAVNNMQQ